MKKMFLAVMIATIVIPSVSAMEQEKQLLLCPGVKALLDRHVPELKDLLREWHSHGDARMGKNVCEKPWLPGYYIKYGVERVANAQRLKAVIQEHSLDLLEVPEKYLYHVPGLPDTLTNENYLVIVKKVEGRGGLGQNLNVQQVKQLYKVALLVEHYDLHPGNYISTAEGKLTIIDTDNCAMPSLQEIEKLKQDWREHGDRIHDGGGICMNPDIINTPLVKLELPWYSKWPNYDDEAYAYLGKKFEQIRKVKTYPQISSKKNKGYKVKMVTRFVQSPILQYSLLSLGLGYLAYKTGLANYGKQLLFG